MEGIKPSSHMDEIAKKNLKQQFEHNMTNLMQS
jgi:hypothetical protein